MATRKTPNTAKYKIVKIDSQFTPEGFSQVDFDLVFEKAYKPTEQEKQFPSTVYIICDNKKLVHPFTIGTEHHISFKTVMAGKVYNDLGFSRALNAQSLHYSASIEFFQKNKK